MVVLTKDMYDLGGMPDLNIEGNAFPFYTTRSSALGSIGWSGTIKNSPGHGMRRTDNLNIVYVLEGLCDYANERGRTQRLVAGDLLLIVPHFSQSYLPAPGKQWSEHYLHCDGPAFDLWLNAGLISPDRVI